MKSNPRSGASKEAYVLDKDGRAVFVPPVHPKWKPFLHWFECLQFNCWMENDKKAYPVRVGPEKEDMWIEINPIVNERTVVKLQTHRYQQVHEAILMITLLARVDHASWLGALARHAQFQIPPYLNFRVDAELPPRFSFYFPHYFSSREYCWQEWQRLFHAPGFSTLFQRDYKHMCAIAMRGLDEQAARSLSLKIAEPIAFNLHVCPTGDSLGAQVASLKNLLHTIKNLKAVTSRADPSIPILKLDYLDATFGACDVHPAVYELVQEIVETGVRIKFISMPANQVGGIWVEQDIRVAWSAFVTSALGLTHPSDGTTVRVEHIALPEIYVTATFIDAFCSALCKTKVLKSVQFDMVLLDQVTPDEQQRAWGWVLYALFSRAANNTVETVQLESLHFTTEMLDQLTEMREAASPLRLLWQWMTVTCDCCAVDRVAPSQRQRVVRVGKGETSQVFCPEGQISSVTLASSRLGTVVQDHEHEAKLEVLITGFGICTVNRASVKLAGMSSGDTSANRDLKTLIFSNIIELMPGVPVGSAEKAGGGRFVVPILRAIGPSIESLAVEARDIDERCVATIFHLCPRLQDLRLRGATLPSMRVFTSGLEGRELIKLTSLELRDFAVPIEAFDGFLGLLEADSKFRRLRIGQGWSRRVGPSTEAAMERVLQRNKYLTHFHLYSVASACWNPHDAGHHGKLVIDTPFPVISRVAFLSAVKASIAMEKRNGGVAMTLGLLTPELSAQIFEFAALATWRRAYAERDAVVPPTQ